MGLAMLRDGYVVRGGREMEADLQNFWDVFSEYQAFGTAPHLSRCSNEFPGRE